MQCRQTVCPFIYWNKLTVSFSCDRFLDFNTFKIWTMFFLNTLLFTTTNIRTQVNNRLDQPVYVYAFRDVGAFVTWNNAIQNLMYSWRQLSAAIWCEVLFVVNGFWIEVIHNSISIKMIAAVDLKKIRLIDWW